VTEEGDVTQRLAQIYQAYIACLNHQDWSNLGTFVDDSVVHNGRPIGLSGYRTMLQDDFRAIPDLSFHVQILVSEPPHIASRLQFDCTPSALLFGMPVNGKRVRFAENVFYKFRGDRITLVWSIIDKAAIAAQL
jgi:predicted ester cyclase